MSGVTFGGKEHITCPPPDGWPERARLITLADAESMVRAENEACAFAVQSRSDFYAEKRKTAHDCDREMLMGDIITAHDHAIDAIRARVKPHNNEVA
jgi:hypothetical protein